METLTDETRKARKQHRCNWCGNIIQKGEKYRYSSYVDGGDMWSFKAHLKCDQIFDAFCKEDRPHWEECTAGYFEEKVVEELQSYVCKDCPQFDKPTPGVTYDRGHCRHPDHWLTCIDKVYGSLVKRGKIKEDSK